MQMGAAKLETSGHSIDTATGQNAPAELSSDRVKKIFTDIAWDYERFNRLSSFGQYISWLETLIDQIAHYARNAAARYRGWHW